MSQLLKMLSLALALPILCTRAATLHAQSFVPAGAPAFVYNGAFDVGPATSTSNYALSNIETGFGNIDLYLSDWGNPGARHFMYQFTNPGDPTAVVHQGSFLYMDVIDMQVGAVWNSYTDNMNLLVAYTWGDSHYLDIYDLTSSATNPVVLNSSMQLSSNCIEFGHIRMDCHKLYGVAIVWEKKGVGLQTMAGDRGAWGPILTLDNTQWASRQDVAFSHSTGELNVHYAYYDPASASIIESVIDWPTLMTAPAGVPLPLTIEDVHTIGGLPNSNIVMDCPDHYNTENWAYTYSDGSNIFVHHVDYNTTGVPATVSVNSGVLGNASTLGTYDAFNPALYYGGGVVDGRSGQIMVGWYTTDHHTYSGYAALEMTADGTALLSTADYLSVPNINTTQLYPYYTYPYQPDLTHYKPAIAFSRNSDGMNTDFMYTTYCEADPGMTSGRFHHAFHKWNDPVFKGNPAPTLHPECGAHIRKALSSETKVSSYPNPFRDRITTTVALAEDALLEQTLTDITGRQLWQHKAHLSKGAHQVSADNLAELVPGTYILTTAINGKRTGTQKVTKQ